MWYHGLKIKFLLIIHISLLTVPNIIAWTEGDALQLQCYRATSTDKPDVTDGLIAASSDPKDWRAGYVRVVKMVNATDPNDTTFFTMLMANDNDTLYLAAVGYLPNNANGNKIRIYFDQNNNGTLEGSSGAPGEYFVELLANGNDPVDGGWNGTAWALNSTKAPGLKGEGVSKGSGLPQLYNWEVQIPLKTTASAGNSYLDLNLGDESGIQFEVILQTGGNPSFFWETTNASNSDASGWAELFLQGQQTAAREISALYSKNYIPTIDGNITNDANWKYAFEKTITLSDFNGNILSNCKLYLKEDQAAGNLIIGTRININPNTNTDYLQVYFDQGTTGNDLNYILNGVGSSQLDDAVRIQGNGTATDMYFNGTAWVNDGANHGSAAAAAVSGTAWEFEISRPFASGGGAQDLNIVTTDSIGFLMRFYDAENSRNYWWSATINEDSIEIDPVDGDFSALGWAVLATGGPFLQPLYPEQNDIISGTYVFMIYAEDEDSGWADIDSAEYRITDMNDRIIIDYSVSTQMTKVDNPNSGLWVSTFNTNTGTTPDGEYNIVFRVKDDDGIKVTSPVSITIQNTGTVGGPVFSSL
ncbi:MAG: hypothetical protein ABIA63_14770, partial [bacterium]